MTNRIMTRSETSTAPIGTVLRGPDDTSDRGCIAVRDKDGWSFTSKHGYTTNIGAGKLCTPRYEVLFMPEVPVKVGDVVTGKAAMKLPPLSVVRAEDGSLMTIIKGLPEGRSVTTTVRAYSDGSGGRSGDLWSDVEYVVVYLPEVTS